MVYTISLGSNLNRKENMEKARERLLGLFPDIRFSTEEDTEPLFFHHSGLFSNQVARFASQQSLEELISCLKSIEQEAGRRPEDKQAEIVKLDIDVLMSDSEVYKPLDLQRDYIQRGLQELEAYTFQ